MMMLWAWAGVPLGVYNIVEEFNVALRVQPQILTLLSLVTWTQCFYYQRQWSVARSLLALTPIVLTMGGIQAGLIVGLSELKNQGVEWPMTLMAVLSAVLLAAGVLRHYWDIWVHRTVRGISFTFVGIDALGDVFSLASVVFQPKLDVLGMAIYGTELVLWIGVFACGGYYNLLPWLRKVRQDEAVNVSHEGSEQDGNGNQLYDREQRQDGIALHDLPSSTSVFRTASGGQNELRQRRESRASGSSRNV